MTTRIRLSASASDVVAMYAAEVPDDNGAWPELDALQAWDGNALVVDDSNREAIADALLELANLYSDKADGRCPTSEGEPRRFCQHAADGLSTARVKVLRAA